jgi:hypothetical protein
VCKYFLLKDRGEDGLRLFAWQAAVLETREKPLEPAANAREREISLIQSPVGQISHCPACHPDRERTESIGRGRRTTDARQSQATEQSH